MRFAVTGTSGFIGRHFLSFLETDHHTGVALPRSIFEQPDQIIIDRLHDVDVVVHLAGRAHKFGPQHADDYFNDNVVLTERLLEISKASNIKRFIFVSTIGVHGTETHGTPFRETDTPAPHNPYAQSKLLAETKVIEFCQTHNIEWVILRPPLVYGPLAPGNIGKLQRLIGSGVPLPFKNIKNKRSVISVDTLCNIIITAATAPHAHGQIYLVSDGIDRSTPDLLRLLAALDRTRAVLWPCPPALLKAALKIMGQYERVAPLFEDLQVDSTKLRQHLKWSGK